MTTIMRIVKIANTLIEYTNDTEGEGFAINVSPLSKEGMKLAKEGYAQMSAFIKKRSPHPLTPLLSLLRFIILLNTKNPEQHFEWKSEPERRRTRRGFIRLTTEERRFLNEFCIRILEDFAHPADGYPHAADFGEHSETRTVFSSFLWLAHEIVRTRET